MSRREDTDQSGGAGVQGRTLPAQNNFEARRLLIGRPSPLTRSWVPYQGLAAAQFAGRNRGGHCDLARGRADVDDPEKIDFEIASYVERAGKPDEAIREYESVVRRDPSSTRLPTTWPCCS